eukprot:942620-Pelagomonas_calceolata.AAC.2
MAHLWGQVQYIHTVGEIDHLCMNSARFRLKKHLSLNLFSDEIVTHTHTSNCQAYENEHASGHPPDVNPEYYRQGSDLGSGHREVDKRGMVWARHSLGGPECCWHGLSNGRVCMVAGSGLVLSHALWMMSWLRQVWHDLGGDDVVCCEDFSPCVERMILLSAWMGREGKERAP